MLATTDATIGFEAAVPVFMMAWEAAKLKEPFLSLNR
jgi:hypothetical protein